MLFNMESVDLNIQRSTLETAKTLTRCIQDGPTEKIFECLINIPVHVQTILFNQSEDRFNKARPIDVAILQNRRNFLPEACDQELKDVVLVLLRKGLQPYATGTKGTPLEVSTTKGNKELIEAIVEFEPDIVKDIAQVKSCLNLACRWGHGDLVDYWIEKFKQVSGENSSDIFFGSDYDLMKSARTGRHKEVAKQIMQKLWTEDESSEYTNTKGTDSDSNRKTSRKVAKWKKRHLPYFDSTWLHCNTPDEFLVDINLSDNSLFNIDGDLIWGLPLLETLNLSNCALRKIPDINQNHDISSTRLQKLNLSHNRLKRVPADLFMIRTLTELNLAFNGIQTIDEVSESFQRNRKCEPGIRWECKSLETLIMNNTQLKMIPDEIQNAVQLKILNVSNSRLTHLPRSWACPLETFKANNNQLTQVEDMSHWRRTLKKVDLSHNTLKEIPETMCQLYAVEDMNVSHNEIDRLPEVKQWKTYRLRILDVSNNAILSLNRDLKEILMKESTSKGRQSVWTRITRLGTAPDWLQDLSLKDDTGECVFSSLLYTRLQELNLSSNRIQEFPETVCLMKALQVLQMSGNPFVTRLPEQLGMLQRLSTFNLDTASIQEPAEVVQLLKTNASGSKATDIVKVLKEKHLDYQPYNGVKMMIIGPKESGKTKLFRLLAGDQTGHTLHSTDDVVCVHKWGASGSIPGSWVSMIFTQQIEFTVWDLKGGEENTVISQTLFTPNTIYLLVWNANKLEDQLPEIRKWMLNVKLLAHGCGIISVGTYAIGSPSPSQSETLSSIFSEEPFLETLIVKDMQLERNNQRSPELKDLSKSLADYAMTMTSKDVDKPRASVGLIGRKVPRAFLDTKRHLEEELFCQIDHKSPRFVTEETFRQIADRNKLTNSSRELKFVIAFLQETGSLIHVSDHTFRLTSLYFLDPNWLCKVLLSPIEPGNMRVLKSQRRRKKRIGIPKEQLQSCFDSTGFGQDRFEEYLELLGRFEIAILATSDSYFLPDLDPEEYPVFEEIEEDTINTYDIELIRLYKTNYLPPGFVRRLVSRILADTRKNKDRHQQLPEPPSNERRFASFIRQSSRTVTWKKGIDITNDDNHLEVELVEQIEAGRNVTYICLSVQSDSKEGVYRGIGFLSDNVEYLFKGWYADIQWYDRKEALTILVPCPVCIRDHRHSMRAIISLCHKFELTDLIIDAIAKKKDTIECSMMDYSEQDRRRIHLKDIVPDIFLLDLEVDKLQGGDIEISDIKLGEGSFGIVFKACIGEESVALKSILRQGFNKQSTDEERIDAIILHFPDFRREIATMSRLKHPCILQMVGVYVQKLWFAMEFAPYGDLESYIDDQLYIPDIPGSLHENHHNFIDGTAVKRLLTFKIAYQIVAAVDYLHQQGIIHTDLKTNNILLFTLELENCVNVKLADYGISQYAATGGVIRAQAGHHAFVAPEIVNGKAFDKRADIFSVGMILYNIMSGMPPGGHRLSIETNMEISEGNRPSFTFQDYTILPNFRHLEETMSTCWEGDPNNRPSAVKLLESMKRPGFCALVECVEITKTTEYGCIAQTTDKTSDHLYVWTSYQESISSGSNRFISRKINLDNYVQEELAAGLLDSQQVCALNHKNILIAASDSDGINSFTSMPGIYTLKPLDQSKRLRFMVSSMLYVPTKEKESDGMLYCGLQDGRLVIYEHKDGNWMIFKTYQIDTIAVPSPCGCMLHLDTRNPSKLLIGCGNKIKAIDTTIYVDEVQPFSTIEAPKPVSIQGLVSIAGTLWCFIRTSSKVILLDEVSGKQLSTFECGMTDPKRGDMTSIIDSDQFIGPLSMPVTWQSESGDPIETDSISETIYVTAIKVVKDTVWIGRSAGDILVVCGECLSGTNKKQHLGRIECVLEVDPLVYPFSGPVVQIQNPTHDKVVAVREVHVGTDSACYQILIWKEWGSEEAKEFEKALKFV